jgi:hypothetical protein
MLADTMRSIRRIAAVAAATACLVWGATPVLADVTISDAGGPLTGVAFDQQSSRLFAVSETGGTNIAVTDATGAKVGAISFSADTESVQGLAVHSGSLFVGDVGDSKGKRNKITVYKLPLEVGNQSYNSYDFRYPDGAHDAKSVLVSGRGRIYIVTAGENPGIYYAELELSRSGVNKLSRASDAPAGVTDGVFLSDGVTMALRTGSGVQVVDASSWETRATLTYQGAPEGESITTFSGDRMLVGAGPQLREEAVPTSDSTVTISPSGEASPTPSPEPSESPGSSTSPTPQETTAPGPEEKATQPAQGGTRLAIAAAAVLALTLGAVVFFRKK